MTKYNYENDVFKAGDASKVGKITLETKNRIRALRKSYGAERLWPKTHKNILDTLTYVKRRVDLFVDHKLSTFAGFNKSVSYAEMPILIKSGTFEGVDTVVRYTLEDGFKTWELSEKLIGNAILESLATNKSLSSIFSSDPIKNFYNAGKRSYFLKLGTFRDRHCMSPRSHLIKLDDRMTNSEILWELVDVNQSFGETKGILYSVPVFIEALKEQVFFINPLLKHIYDAFSNETNPLLKSSFSWMLSSELLVLVDKMKNYVEASGNNFGTFLTPSRVYASLREKDSGKLSEDEIKKLYAEKDYNLSRTSFIFKKEYLRTGTVERVNGLLLDTSIITLNNAIAQELERFKKHGIIAKSKNYVIIDPSKNSPDCENMPEKYMFGPIDALNFKEDRLVGRLFLPGKYAETALEDFLRVYLCMKKPKDPLINGLVNSWLGGERFEDFEVRQKAIQEVYKMSYKDQTNGIYRQVIKAILKIDPLKSKGNPILF